MSAARDPVASAELASGLRRRADTHRERARRAVDLPVHDQAGQSDGVRGVIQVVKPDPLRRAAQVCGAAKRARGCTVALTQNMGVALQIPVLSAVHDSILSGNGVSGNPGAVQKLTAAWAFPVPRTL